MKDHYWSTITQQIQEFLFCFSGLDRKVPSTFVYSDIIMGVLYQTF